jgi:hypothetical protein
MRAAARRLSWILAAVAVLGAALVAGATLLERHDAVPSGQTQGEKIALIKGERSRLQARADAEGRIGLLSAFRIAALLTDALATRADSDEERPLDQLTATGRQAFADIDSLNAALRSAVARPSEGARRAAMVSAERARGSLERLAGIGDLPLVLQYTPRFVPPRRATGDLTLAPRSAGSSAAERSLQLSPGGKVSEEPAVPTVPRYAPAFAAAREDDPPVQVEIVGLHLMSPDGGPPPMLAIGSWRGQATVAPERLRFSVPRDAFATDAVRTTFATGLLTFRRGARATAVELLFVVLPDRPGSFALDQKVRTLVPEANTLVSPEILARAAAGETRSVRRCFDPPAGWRFDKQSRRLVVVERLGWLDDVGDPTLNGGSVEFAADEGADQVCVVVTAKPVTKAARTATIGRFEATLVRDRPEDRVVQSGVRALDWREAVRVPLEPGMVEWKLYLRLFDEIDREFDGSVPSGLPFLHIATEPDGKALVLKADAAAEP